MLVASPRHLPEDLEAWKRAEREDANWCLLRTYRRRVDQARTALRDFARAHESKGYVGVSWGKDSVCVAHLASTVASRLPLVYLRFLRIENPDYTYVRDAYLASHPDQRYEEFTFAPAYKNGEIVEFHDQKGGGRYPHQQACFIVPERAYGALHVSGVRAAESSGRRIRMRVHGQTSPNTCAPIGWWQGEDVFAFLFQHRLPVHPVYAMTRGGLWDRRRLRVNTIGGPDGTGFGRGEWERLYYPEILETRA